MRTRIFMTALCAAVLMAAPVLAGPPASGAGSARAMSASDQGTRIVTGTVKEFEANKWLDVRTMDNRDETFQLDQKDMKVTVEPGVKVGSKVRVTEKVEGGSRTLTVEKLS